MEHQDFRPLRRLLDLSVQDVSSATGISMWALAAAERGRHQLTSPQLAILRAYLIARLQVAAESSEVARILVGQRQTINR